MSFCQCSDLLVPGSTDKYYSGPQCLHETTSQESNYDRALSKATKSTTSDLTQQSETKNAKFLLTAQTNTEQAAAKAVPEVQKVTEENKNTVEDHKEDQTCNDHGVFYNKICYCDKKHSGLQCEFDLGHPGVKGSLAFVFYSVALMLGIITGSFVAKIYNANSKQLFL